jgi:hypothetical protein
VSQNTDARFTRAHDLWKASNMHFRIKDKYPIRWHAISFQMGKKSRLKIPLMVAGGGGGISNSQDLSSAQLQHGQGFNATMGNASGTEYGPNPGGEKIL